MRRHTQNLTNFCMNCRSVLSARALFTGLHGCRQLVMWVVWFTPVNERNPDVQILSGTCCGETLQKSGRRQVFTVLMGWAIGVLQGPKQIEPPRKGEGKTNLGRSSNWGLQFVLMKAESLVIVDEKAAVKR